MFRIRRIFDVTTSTDLQHVREVQRILREQFSGLSERKVLAIPRSMQNPFKDNFRYILFVAETSSKEIRGFALISHDPNLNFCFLDYVSTSSSRMGRGIGGALYERVVREARALNSIGLFYECLPDDPKLCRDPQVLKQNIARLRFYERYGARPIINTAYETPLEPGDDCPPYLVFDGLGLEKKLPRRVARKIVAAILKGKYPDSYPSEYFKKVVESFKDDPVQLRPFKYVKAEKQDVVIDIVPSDSKIAVIATDQHQMHHVRERGYVEAPVRIDKILAELRKANFIDEVAPKHFSDKYLQSVHDEKFVSFLQNVCVTLAADKAVYPYVFPIRNQSRPPQDLPLRAGYYCIDTFTPLSSSAYSAARRAVDCALTGAQLVGEGHRLAYVLVRPPGHHAERASFGGFCYFNNAAIAAELLREQGKVAILDIDYHHGNGQQSIFYHRSDILTVSIHGHPRFAYPYFSGFEDERGAGAGIGYNVNLPLPEQITSEQYRGALANALKRIARFSPKYLLVALGLDTAKNDPTGSWNLTPSDFEENGKMIGALYLPTLVVQEGGYRTLTLGRNASAFLRGLWSSALGRVDLSRKGQVKETLNKST